MTIKGVSRARRVRDPCFLPLVILTITAPRVSGSTSRKKDAALTKTPFPTWSFQSPNHRMEWNDPLERPPLIMNAVEALESATDYDNIVIGILDSGKNAISGSSSSSKADDLGFFYHKLDRSNANILSELIKEKETRSNNQHGKKGMDHEDDDESLDSDAKMSSSDWEEVTRLCRSNGGGAMKVQKLILYQIRGNITQDPETVGRQMGAKLAAHLAADTNKQGGGKKWALVLPPRTPNNAFVSEMTTALWTSLYVDKRFKSQQSSLQLLEKRRRGKNHAVSSLDVIWDRPDEIGKEDNNGTCSNSSALVVTSSSPVDCVPHYKLAQQAIRTGQMVASGMFLAKDVVNAPHNVLNSESLADTARRLAAQFPRQLTCKILNTQDCEQHGMGAYLGVARGSETHPQFIHLTYRPSRSSLSSSHKKSNNNRKMPIRKLGIVGKGLLFDTGGYNIKTNMMELMKFDCGGAAAVLGAAKSIAQLEPPDVEVHFVIAACENMINERAMVPGDILTASNGKTIEVINTDAEGRLTMADALVYVDKTLGCDEIVELSTLTGAAMVALGGSIGALFTASDCLAQRLEAASTSTGEKVWRMPLEEEYNESIKSKIADLKNLGGRHGGAITAALFLQNFVEGNKPFAHIDMAGPVWSLKHGATGFGAKLVTQYVIHHAGHPQEEEEEENTKKNGFTLRNLFKM